MNPVQIAAEALEKAQEALVSAELAVRGAVRQLAESEPTEAVSEPRIEDAGIRVEAEFAISQMSDATAEEFAEVKARMDADPKVQEALAQMSCNCEEKGIGKPRYHSGCPEHGTAFSPDPEIIGNAEGNAQIAAADRRAAVMELAMRQLVENGLTYDQAEEVVTEATERGRDIREQRAAQEMSDPEHYARMREAGSVHPCQVEGCRITQEEHHRLVYGLMAENREMKRRLREAGL